ncbi:MAG: BofC C-terminal domain-containing protein [Butyricicoccus sp.]|nr:BofC C-terminal domain-containing protein [Butyricicoccus sp.]
MNRSRSPFWLLAFGGAAAAFLFSLWLLFASQQLTPTDTATAAATTSSPPSYYATLSDNHVVIYLHGQSEPVLVTDIDARTLPDADREQLEQGIQLDGAADVNQLLEDYSG